MLHIDNQPLCMTQGATKENAMRQLGVAGGLRVVKYVYEVTKKGMYIETEYQIDPNLFPSGAYPHGDGEWQKIRSQVLPVTTDEEFLNWLDYNNTGHEYDPTLFKMTGGGSWSGIPWDEAEFKGIYPWGKDDEFI